jgi:TPR repeat protein
VAWLRIAITLLATLAAPTAANAENDLAALQLQAEQGEVEAQTELGVRYFRGDGVAQDDAAAARWLLLAAEQGDPDAQNKIGFLRAQGRGVPKDDAKAALWYQRSAEQGDAKGQFNIGLACDEGRGVPEDPEQASEWWLRAAAQGHTNAQLKLAVAYAMGRGVRRNPALAFFFAEIVATRLPDDAPTAPRQEIIELRDSLAAVLGPRETAKAKEAAAEWQPKPELPTSLRPRAH